MELKSNVLAMVALDSVTREERRLQGCGPFGVGWGVFPGRGIPTEQTI